MVAGRGRSRAPPSALAAGVGGVVAQSLVDGGEDRAPPSILAAGGGGTVAQPLVDGGEEGTQQGAAGHCQAHSQQVMVGL